MDLGQYASYPLPARIKETFGVDTAGQLADQLGVRGELTPQLARDAESAYNDYTRGDTQPAQQLLARLGLDDSAIAQVMSSLSAS